MVDGDVRSTSEILADEAVKLDAAAIHALTRAYMAQRVYYQQSYYRTRSRQYDASGDFMSLLGAGVMAISTGLALINVGGANQTIVPLLIAILPAFAALVASFRQLYQWERQAGLYRDADIGLDEALLIMPDLDDLTDEIALKSYPKLVKQVEGVLRDEVNQWGQIALGQQPDSDIDPITQFVGRYRQLFLDDDGKVNQDSLQAFNALLVGDAPIASSGQQTADSGISASSATGSTASDADEEE